MQKNKTVALLISFIFFFFLYPFFYQYPLHPLVPYLVFSSFFTPLTSLLWYSLGFGILMDLTSSMAWGGAVISYSLTTFLLFKRFRIREYNHYTFLILTLIYTFVCNLILSMQYFAFIFTLPWMKYIFFTSPTCMGIFTVTAFILPLILWKKMEKLAIMTRKRLLRK